VAFFTQIKINLKILYRHLGKVEKSGKETSLGNDHSYTFSSGNIVSTKKNTHFQQMNYQEFLKTYTYQLA
jgi:hypothetical protein